VLILDLDAHCGGGTAALIASEPRISQVDVSVSEFDRYIPTRRVRLETVDRAEDYLPTISRLLDESIIESAFDLCIYNAGMDPYEKSDIGALAGITREILAERERLVFDRCESTRTPIAFVLAGGYIGGDFDRASLVDLHRLTLEESARVGRVAL